MSCNENLSKQTISKGLLVTDTNSCAQPVKEHSCLSTSSIGSHIQDENATIIFKKCSNLARQQANGLTNNREGKVRFMVCTMSLIGVIFCQMSRSILNLSLASMTVDREYSKDKLKFQKCQESSDFCSQVNETKHNTNLYKPYLNESQIINLTEDFKIPLKRSGSKIKLEEWEIKLLPGAMFIGYLPSIMLSGSLAETYGVKYLMFTAVTLSAFINLLTESFARFNYWTLVMSRVVLGICQGPIVPTQYELFNKWLTASETSLFISLTRVSLSCGTLVGSLIVATKNCIGLDWQSSFYFSAGLCLAWSVFWLKYAESKPEDHTSVGKLELRRITRKKPQRLDANIEDKEYKNEKVPWFKILTSPTVISLTIAKLTYNCINDFAIMYTPIYLYEVYNTKELNATIIMGLVAVINISLISFVGWLAHLAVNKKALGINRTGWRKIFQSSAGLSGAFAFFCLTRSEISELAASLLILALCLTYMFGVGGEAMLPYDISLKYPARIMGIAHSIGASSTILVTMLCVTIDTWNTIFYILSTLAALGSVLFILFVKAELFLPQDLALVSNDKKDKIITVSVVKD